MTGQLGSFDCHAELLLREKNLEGRKLRHALVHRNAGKKLNALEINMTLNWVFENMYTFEWEKWNFSKTTSNYYFYRAKNPVGVRPSKTQNLFTLS